MESLSDSVGFLKLNQFGQEVIRGYKVLQNGATESLTNTCLRLGYKYNQTYQRTT
jgi:hypothetical protein